MFSTLRKINPVFILIIVPLIWGVNFTIMKVGLQSLSPMPYNTSRLIVATIISWILVYVFKAYKKINVKDIRKILLVSILGFAIPQIGITLGVNLTTAGNSSLIMSLIPISVLIINVSLDKEQVHKWAIRGIIISFIGVILVILGSGNGLHISTSDLKGVAVILVAQFFAGFFTVFSKPLVEKYSPYQIIAYAMTVSALLFFIISFRSMGNVNWLLLSSPAWLSIIYSGIFALAVGNSIWVWAVKKIGPTKTAVYNNLTPVFAIITGCVFLHESFGWFQLIGAFIILVGLYITQKSKVPVESFVQCNVNPVKCDCHV